MDRVTQQEEAAEPLQPPTLQDPASVTSETQQHLTPGRQARLLPYVYLFMVQAVNAVYNVLVKKAVKDSNPLVFSLYRDVLASPILIVGAAAIEGWRWPKRRDVWKMALLGLTGMFGNQFLFILGVKLTNAAVAAVVNQSQCAVATVIAIGLGRERLTVYKSLGIALSMTGAAIMVAWHDVKLYHGKEDDKKETSTQVGGLSAVLGSCVCMAVYYNFQKPMLKDYTPVLITAYSYVFGALTMGLASGLCAFGDLCGNDVSTNGSSEWRIEKGWILPLAFAVVFNSVIKYALQSEVNTKLDVSTLTTWSTLVPILTFGLQILYLHDTVWLTDIIGMLVTIAGLAVLTLTKESMPTEPKLQEQALGDDSNMKDKQEPGDRVYDRVDAAS